MIYTLTMCWNLSQSIVLAYALLLSMITHSLHPGSVCTQPTINSIVVTATNFDWFRILQVTTVFVPSLPPIFPQGENSVRTYCNSLHLVFMEKEENCRPRRTWAGHSILSLYPPCLSSLWNMPIWYINHLIKNQILWGIDNYTLTLTNEESQILSHPHIAITDCMVSPSKALCTFPHWSIWVWCTYCQTSLTINCFSGVEKYFEVCHKFFK